VKIDAISFFRIGFFGLVLVALGYSTAPAASEKQAAGNVTPGSSSKPA